MMWTSVGALCAALLSLGCHAVDDVAAWVQESTRGRSLAPKGDSATWTERLGSSLGALEGWLREEIENLSPEMPAELEMAQDPQDEKPPIVHGVIFERRVDSVEDGTTGALTIDHGCGESDQFGDNYCEFPNGDTIHLKMVYKLAKPISNGYMAFSGEPQLHGLGGFFRNAAAGRKTYLTSKLVPINFECSICGSPCTFHVFGKDHSFPTQPCPLPANETITLFDSDITLPSGDFLALVQSKMQASVAVRRLEGERDDPVVVFTTLFQMSRINRGMPRMM